MPDCSLGAMFWDFILVEHDTAPTGTSLDSLVLVLDSVTVFYATPWQWVRVRCEGDLLCLGPCLHFTKENSSCSEGLQTKTMDTLHPTSCQPTNNTKKPQRTNRIEPSEPNTPTHQPTIQPTIQPTASRPSHGTFVLLPSLRALLHHCSTSNESDFAEGCPSRWQARGRQQHTRRILQQAFYSQARIKGTYHLLFTAMRNCRIHLAYPSRWHKRLIIPPEVDFESCRSPAKDDSWNKPNVQSMA